MQYISKSYVILSTIEGLSLVDMNILLEDNDFMNYLKSLIKEESSTMEIIAKCVIYVNENF